MARFVVNQPIDTREPRIAVDPPLAVGMHRFQLEVFDQAGNRSRPDIVTIEVRTDTLGGLGGLDGGVIGGGTVEPIRPPDAATNGTVAPAPAPPKPRRTRKPRSR